MPTIEIALSLLQLAITETPALAADLKALFSKETVTPGDIAALRAKVADESYGKFVPDSGLPPENVVAMDPPAAPPVEPPAVVAPPVEPPVEAAPETASVAAPNIQHIT